LSLSAVAAAEALPFSGEGDECLDEFSIPSAAGSGELLFYDRSPADRAQPIEGFWVRVTDQHLSAAGQVYAGYAPSHPAPMFADMARQWSGWRGELAWRSLEGELALRCSHDRLGHIAIRIELRFGHMPDDWRVEATVMAEGGQLEEIARRAARFFGRAR
jgi:hypothetical protein